MARKKFEQDENTDETSLGERNNGMSGRQVGTFL